MFKNGDVLKTMSSRTWFMFIDHLIDELNFIYLELSLYV